MSLGKRWIGRTVVGLVVLAWSVSAFFLFASGLSDDDLLFGPPSLAFVAVGSLLAIRVPENRVSWLVLGIGALMVVIGLTNAALEPELAGQVSGVIIFGLFIPGVGLFLPLWFPTGEPPSRRWNWVQWGGALGIVLLFSGQLVKVWFEGGDLSGVDECTSPGRCASIFGLAVLLVAIGSAIASLVIRWRRSEGLERQQLRWLIPGFLLLGIGILAEFGGFQDSILAVVGLIGGFLMVPVSIGFAVTRYRLYDIDRIVSRTLSYAVVVGLLGVVFALLAVWIPQAIGVEAPLFVAGATLAVAALFNPLRKRVQGLVDRRFNRSRYDAERVMDEFAGSLRDRVDPQEVVDGLSAVVAETMQPETVAVWVKG